MAQFVDLLQIAGGIILCAGYIPQIRRILKTRSAHDLSLFMWVSVLGGLVLMEIYAAILFARTGTFVVLLTNSVSLMFSIVMVALILTFGARRPSLASIRGLRRRPGRQAQAATAEAAQAA